MNQTTIKGGQSCRTHRVPGRIFHGRPEEHGHRPAHRGHRGKVPPTVPCRPSPGRSRLPLPPRAPTRRPVRRRPRVRYPLSRPRGHFLHLHGGHPARHPGDDLRQAIDDNGVLVRTSTDKPPYFAVGFMSEKANHKFRYIWLYKVRAKPMTETYKQKRARPSPGRTAPSSGRPSSAPRTDAIRPWPMKARTALTPPRPPPSSRASMNPRSRRRRMGRNSLLAPIPMIRGRSPFTWAASLPEKKEATP